MSENFYEKMMQRALGLVEGIAFGLDEGIRDALLGAAEDIDSGLKSLESRVKEATDEFQADQNLIHALLKDKDDLLTENSQLRDMLEKMATGGGGEVATAPAELRNDESLGCTFCKSERTVKMFSRSTIDIWVKGGELVVDTPDVRESLEIEFCPKCGRKL